MSLVSGEPVGDMAAVTGLERTSNLFRYLVLGMAERLQTNADWIVAVMSSESAGTFSPSVRNPNGGATGLIQFMPSTAKSMGTTTDALAALTAEEQLAYVERYFFPFTGKLNSPEDVYMAVFMPVHVGKSPDNVISTAGQKVYEANKGFDRDQDGVITNREVGSVVRGKLAGAESRPRIPVFAEEPDDGSGRRLAAGCVLIGGLYLIWRGVRGG